MPRMHLVALAAVAACARPAPTPRCPQAEPARPAAAALGEALTFDSTVLGERRVINVYLPPGYATSTERFPVLYMPDGGMGEDFPHVVGSVDVSIKNAVIRPVIVVGIENTERRRDLVGPTTVAEELEAAPHAGGADRFRAFLRDELKPFIAERYRTSEESAIVGESLAGLFVVETLLLEPALFDGYIAADPSVWWNEQALVRDAGARLAAWTAGARTLYFATSVDAEAKGGVDTLTAALRDGAPAEITWIHEPMPAAHHDTIFPTAALHGIRMVFAPRGGTP
jgi:predicted alpha/beta superfamily hydrolase